MGWMIQKGSSEFESQSEVGLRTSYKHLNSILLL